MKLATTVLAALLIAGCDSIQDRMESDKAAKAIAAERQRIASLPPEQRAAEEKRRAEYAEVAVRERAQRLAEQAKAQAIAQAIQKKRNDQLKVAAGGAILLKRMMKDPEAFELKSLVVMPNGTACYNYRAKNSFGAIFPSSAVLSVSGKSVRMLTQEQDGNAFANVWNKNCTLGGGTDHTLEANRLLG